MDHQPISFTAQLRKGWCYLQVLIINTCTRGVESGGRIRPIKTAGASPIFIFVFFFGLPGIKILSWCGWDQEPRLRARHLIMRHYWICSVAHRWSLVWLMSTSSSRVQCWTVVWTVLMSWACFRYLCQVDAHDARNCFMCLVGAVGWTLWREVSWCDSPSYWTGSRRAALRRTSFCRLVTWVQT